MANLEQKISDLAAGTNAELTAAAVFAADTGSTGITKKFNFDQMAVQTLIRLVAYTYAQNTVSQNNPLVTKDYVDHNRAAQLFPTTTGGLWANLAALQAGPWYNLAGQTETPSQDEWARVTNAAGFQDIYTHNGTAWVLTGTDSFNMTSDQAAALNSLITRALRDKLYNKVGGTNSGNTLAIEERTVGTITPSNSDITAGTSTTVQGWLQLLTNVLQGTRNDVAGKEYSKTFYQSGALASNEMLRIPCTLEPGDMLHIIDGRTGSYTAYGIQSDALQTVTDSNSHISVIASTFLVNQVAFPTILKGSGQMSDSILIKAASTMGNNIIYALHCKKPIGNAVITTAISGGTWPIRDGRAVPPDERPRNVTSARISAGSTVAFNNITWGSQFIPGRMEIRFSTPGKAAKYVIIQTDTARIMEGDAGLVELWRKNTGGNLVIVNTSGDALQVMFYTDHDFTTTQNASDTTSATRLTIQDARVPLEKNVFSASIAAQSAQSFTGVDFGSTANPTRTRLIVTADGGYAEYVIAFDSLLPSGAIARFIGGLDGVIHFYKDSTTGNLIIENLLPITVGIMFFTDYRFSPTMASASVTGQQIVNTLDCTGPKNRIMPYYLPAGGIISVDPIQWGANDQYINKIVASTENKMQVWQISTSTNARLIDGVDELIKLYNDTASSTGDTLVIENKTQEVVCLIFFCSYFLNPTILAIGTTAGMTALTVEYAKEHGAESNITAFEIAAGASSKFSGMQWDGGKTRLLGTIKPVSPSTDPATFQEYLIYSGTEARIISGAVSMMDIFKETDGSLIVKNMSTTDPITLYIMSAYFWSPVQVSTTVATATALTVIDCRVASSGGGGGGMALVVGAQENNVASFATNGQVKDSGIQANYVAQILNTTSKPITFSCTGDELHDKLAEYGKYFASYATNGEAQTITINITADATDFSSLAKVPVIPERRGMRFIINGGNKKVFCPRSMGGGSSLQIANAKLVLGANNGWHNFQDMDFLYIQSCSVDGSGVPANTARISFNGIKKLYVSISSFTKTQAGNDVSIVTNNQDVRILGAACNYNGSAWSSGVNCRFYIDSNVPAAIFSDADNGGTGIYGSAIITDFRANRAIDTYQRRLTTSATDNIAAFNAYGHTVDTGIKKGTVSQEVDTTATPITISCTGNELQAKLLQFVKKQPPQTTEGVLQEVEITITTGQTQFAAQNQPVIPDTRGIKFKILASGTRKTIMMPYIGEGANVEFSNIIIKTTDDDIYGIKNANHVAFYSVIFDASQCQNGSNVWVDDTKDIKFISVSDFDFGDPTINTVFDISGSNVFLEGMTTSFGDTLKFAGGSNSKLYITAQVGATVLSNFANGDGGFMEKAIVFDNRTDHGDDTYIRKPEAATAGIIPTYKASGQLDVTGINPASLTKETPSSMYTISCTADELRSKLLDYINLMPRQGSLAQGGALQGITINITASAGQYSASYIPYIPDTRGNFFIINLNQNRIICPKIGRESSLRISNGILVFPDVNPTFTWDYARAIEVTNCKFEPEARAAGPVLTLNITGCRNVQFTDVAFESSVDAININATSSNIIIAGPSTSLRNSKWIDGYGSNIVIKNDVDRDILIDQLNGDLGIKRQAVITDLRNNYGRLDSILRTDYFMRGIRSPVINSGMEWKINLTDVWGPGGHGVLRVLFMPVTGSRGGMYEGGIRWGDMSGGIFDQWTQEDNVIGMIFEDNTDLTIENPNYEAWRATLYYFQG